MISAYNTNKFVSALVAQMDRATASDAVCRWFESSRGCQPRKEQTILLLSRLFLNEKGREVRMPDLEQKQKRAYRKTSETQEIIFNTAITLMAEKGFQGTTVRDICALSGIPIGTFYNCYRSKVDILKRIYDEGDAYIQESISREAAGLKPLDQLRVFAAHYAELNERTGIDVLRVLFYPSNQWFSIIRPMQTLIRQFVASGQQCGDIRADLSTPEIVDWLFDILRGVCYNWCVCDGGFDLMERINAHMALFCSAIAA